MATDKMYKTSVAVPTVVSTHEPRDTKSCRPKQSEINTSPFFRGSSDKRLFCLLSQRGFSTLKWPSQVVPLIISHSFVFLRIRKTSSSPDFLLHKDKYTKQSSSVSEASNEKRADVSSPSADSGLKRRLSRYWIICMLVATTENKHTVFQ